MLMLLINKMTTLTQLIYDINNSKKHEYAFIRVLNKDDRSKFMSNVPETHYNDIYITKKIPLKLWINIIHAIKSNSDYIIYRNGYDTENKGKLYRGQSISHKYVVSMWSIYSNKKSNNFMDLFANPKLIHILLQDDTITTFEFNATYMLSSWENCNYSKQLGKTIANKLI